MIIGSEIYTPLRVAFRWIVSLAVGAAIVYVLALAGLYAFGWFDEQASDRRQTHPIELLSSFDRARLKDELGLDQRRARPAPAPPKPVMVPRQISGFVQLEVLVGPDGDVLDAEVLGAVPAGYFEENALEMVRKQRYEPSPLGSYRQTEVVPFSVTVDPAEIAQPDGF